MYSIINIDQRHYLRSLCLSCATSSIELSDGDINLSGHINKVVSTINICFFELIFALLLSYNKVEFYYFLRSSYRVKRCNVGQGIFLAVSIEVFSYSLVAVVSLMP